MKKLFVAIASMAATAFSIYPVSAHAQSYSDPATYCDIDPLIVQLDSMAYSLFTRDKFFVSDEQLLSSINMPYDAIPKYTEDQIKQKMKLIPAEFQMTYNSQVKQFIDLFAYKRRGLMTRCLANGQIYFPVFEEVLDRKGLPIELKYLPIVESAFNPIAVSRAGATGLWQLMHGTGTMLGLEVNSYVDERRDPVKSTEAAADFLKKLYAMYGDWHLVLAAYNSGPGNVNKAIARAGGVRNFWAIMNYLPAETRSYVPTFIAAVYVMHYHDDYKLLSAEPKRELYMVDTVLITEKVSLKHISTVLGIGEDELQFLNPSIKKGIIPKLEKGFPLNLPVSYFAAFEARKYEIHNDTTQLLQNTEVVLAASPKLIYHKVLRNETLTVIAGKYNVSTSSIRKWNGMNSSSVYPGMKLKIYYRPSDATTPQYSQAFANRIIEKESKDTLAQTPVTDTNLTAVAGLDTLTKVQPKLPTNAAIKMNPDCNCIYYVVQPGDTLWSIAKKYEGITVEKLKADNKTIKDRQIRIGETIKIFLP